MRYKLRKIFIKVIMNILLVILEKERKEKRKDYHTMNYKTSARKN